MDVENLHSGQKFKDLPDTYAIFIIEKDFYGQGEAVYPIERINLATGKFFEDGEHILYMNGEYRGESDECWRRGNTCLKKLRTFQGFLLKR